MSTAQPGGLRPFAFVLAVQDVAATAAYLQAALGFASAWGDGADWRLLVREGVRLMIGHCPDAMPARETGDHSYFAYLHVDDLDAFHAEVAARGAIILAAPADKPWGMREMLVGTPDGHRMMFGQEIMRQPSS